MKLNIVNKIVIAIYCMVIMGCDNNLELPLASNATQLSDKDKKEIRDLAEDIPLILAEDGFDVYQSYFHGDYTNWYMTNDKPTDREEFLSMVKTWHDEGNRATTSKLIPIEYIPIDSNTVVFLNAQREEFQDEALAQNTKVRDMRFVSIYKKVEGKWMLLFTGFMDNPNFK